MFPSEFMFQSCGEAKNHRTVKFNSLYLSVKRIFRLPILTEVKAWKRNTSRKMILDDSKSDLVLFKSYSVASK